MSEADKKRILERLTNMRGEILAKIRPRELRNETETPPEQPYVFLRQRMEKPGKIIQGISDFLEWVGLVTVAIFRVVRFFAR
ncbi:hypothetical protein ACCS54_11790 [Rhizobium johnstonii]|uniref:hypothetical protein n=1 Tax=Rhizobium TaxID=379 RepID=UPI0010311AD5|nr:hypothetical protein [Rhizobium leguminosarum]WSG93729.1 hypothetical protein U8P76_13255 [Rhizobium johnstonii]MBY5386307.1 hypothetical protein [Rhizobium leguminosarum]MBY5430091.1 hypothetical protein [Rhizobium leguminosarum]NEH96317.1 hypothetical protein [Rhizobium leguminosarum]NEJ43904.1 hypothetical protein [Rhizobium leguminosarum]